jgi:hypothetical protein
MKPYIFILIALLSVLTVAAQEDYSNLEPEDLADAIAQGEIKNLANVEDQQLAAALSSKPEIVTELPDIHLIRALDNNPSLLDDPKGPIFVDLTKRVAATPTILNNKNEKAVKDAWFKGFGIRDNGVLIANFDGSDLTTHGEAATTFTLADFPGASVERDGSLVTSIGKFVGTKGLSLKRSENGAPIKTEGQFNYNVVGGEVEIGTSVKNAALFLSCESEGYKTCAKVTYNLPRSSLPGKYTIGIEQNKQVDRRVIGGTVSYQGNFRFFRGDKGDEINTDFGAVEGFVIRDTNIMVVGQANKRFPITSHTIKGAITDPGDRERGEFSSKIDEFIIEKGVMVDNFGETKLVYQNPKGSRLYYSEAGKDFCNDQFSCVVNIPGVNDIKFREKLEFRNVQNNDQILVTSPVYFDKVIAENIGDGSAAFASIDSEENLLGAVLFEEGGKIRVNKGLASMQAGRIDAIYEEDGERKMQHWSSNSIQPKEVSKYFDKPRNSFVTCTIGSNCEERFARSFGKVIGARDGSAPRASVILSGDTTFTVKSIEKWCRNQGGCYIYNSRDTPTTTMSREILVTGHHFKGEKYAFRDAPELKRDEQGDIIHNPIDRLYYADLPSGPNVEEITSSSCNSLKEPTDGGRISSDVVLLVEKYPRLKQVQGYNGKAPLYERLSSLGTEDDIRMDKFSWGKNKEEGGPKGTRGWIQKGPTEGWVYTDGEKVVDIRNI